MKKQYESITPNNLKYKDIDPYGEEDWDEYEIKKNDKFYFYALSDDKIITGIASGEVNGDQFSIKILECSDKSLKLENKSIKLSNAIKNKINTNQIDSSVHKSNGIEFITIVNDFKYLTYYKNVHEQVRRNLYGFTKKFHSEIKKLENGYK